MESVNEYFFIEDGTTLVYDNHIFFLHRTNKSDSKYWRCKTKNCAASVTISPSGTISRYANNHFYGCTVVKDIKIEKIQFVRELKERCQKETLPINQIYDQEIARLSEKYDAETIASNMPSFSEIKTLLYVARREKIQDLPKSLDEICIDENFGSTKGGLRFLLFDTNDANRAIGFASNRGLEILQNCTQWHADATFQIAPELFYQCLIIHGLFKEQLFPCIFILMVNKNTDLYDMVLDKVKRKSMELGYILNPKSLLCDFELAMINSFRLNFPGISIRGCAFHFAQCIYKKVLNIGLKRLYCNNEIYSNWIGKLMILCYVPLSHVNEAFDLLLQKRPNDNLINELVDYFKKTWLNGSYPLELWNHSMTIGPRTNNHSEGFHSKLNKMCGSSHPNFFKFIEIFQTIEATYSVTYERRLNGQGPPKRRKIDIERDEQIRNCVNRLLMGEIDLDIFLNSLIK